MQQPSQQQKIDNHELCPQCNNITLPKIKKDSHATGRMCAWCKAVVDRAGKVEYVEVSKIELKQPGKLEAHIVVSTELKSNESNKGNQEVEPVAGPKLSYARLSFAIESKLHGQDLEQAIQITIHELMKKLGSRPDVTYIAEPTLKVWQEGG